MRNVSRSLTALALSLALFSSSALASFQPIRAEQSFADVPTSHWAHDYISQSYTLGLMSGTGGGQFSPSAQMQVAEIISLCVRLRDIYQGGDGVLDQSGEHWYDSAVEQALELGLVTQGQFDRYDRPATRAELAGLLAHALPETEYGAINQITALPDVTASTPYSQEIFTLYNAGILTGSDMHGTFTPERSITRAEVCALACRLALPETREALSLVVKPADTTVRATGRKLYVAGIPVYGVVDIAGKFYIPVEALDDRNVFSDSSFYASEYENTLSLRIPAYYYGDVTVPVLNFWAAPPGGHVMGTAELSPLVLQVKEAEFRGAIYTLDGKYPMVSLDALGAVADGVNFRLNPESTPTLAGEDDLAGGPLAGLQRSTDRETVTAIHDYLVNTLTYNPLVSAPYGTTQATLDKVEQAFQQAEETYSLPNNVTLATKYGICQNYAELFRTMCIRSGIPCIMISGMGNGGSHAWNQVYVDGEWLYVDCTFDDPVSSKPTLNHTYCLVGPDVMARNHYWDGEDYPMPDQYDPAWEQLDPNNITSADMFRKCLVAQVMMGKTNFSLRTTKSGAYGGIACLYVDYEGLHWSSARGGYNKSTGTYDYQVEYW